MDAQFMHLFMDNFSTNGIVLSTEQRSALESSLIVLAHEMNFRKLYFWGKIDTASDPYFIVQGLEDVKKCMERKTLFSQDCIKWALLNPCTDEMRKKVRKVRGLFAGDLSHRDEEEEEEPEPEEEEEGEEAVVRMKEEDRLIATIDWIDNDTKLVPRGASFAP